MPRSAPPSASSAPAEGVREAGASLPCGYCDGLGEVVWDDESWAGIRPAPCAHCRGSGREPEEEP